MCQILRKYDPQWNQSQCDVIKSNDIILEIDKIAHKDGDIKTSL